MVCACSGVGITKVDLDSNRIGALYIIAVLYFIVNTTYEMHRGINTHAQDEVDVAQMILHVVLLSLDGIIYVWIFVALYETISSLNDSEEYKLLLYHKFTVVIMVACLATVVFTICQLDFMGYDLVLHVLTTFSAATTWQWW